MLAVAPLLLAVAAILAVTLFDFAFRPTFRRLAFRNLLRRRNEAVLVVIGSLLGTAIITSSFIVGDTLDASIRDLARTQYGPIDELVYLPDARGLDEVEDRLDGDPIAGTDGRLTIVSASTTAVTTGARGRLAEPRAMVHEVDFDDARRFGADEGSTGFAGAGDTPGAGEAVVNDDLAGDLGLGVGDDIELFLYGTSVTLEITGTVPRLGVAGFYPLEGARSPVVFVEPGTLEDLAADEPAGARAAPPEGRVAVSNDGGVFDGASGSDAVTEALEGRLEGLEGVDVFASKQDVLDEATEAGEIIGQLFTGIGGFSVIAGVLLLVNIFVMLAEERKSELGILRAVGLRRNHLVRAFGLEGNIYSLLAAVLGGLTGVALGRVVVAVTFGIFNSGEGEGAGLDMRFAVEPASVVAGVVIGLSICLLTVWGTSLRIGRLNVIRAIRDLPEPPRAGHRLRTVVLASAGVAVGGGLFSAGLSGEEPFTALMGPPIAFFCAVPLARRLVPARVAVTVLCLLALGWGIFCFALLPDVFASSEVFVFVVQGIVLVGAAVAVAIANDDQLNRLTDRLSGSPRGLAIRLGLANPLAKRLRTGLLLGMYSIVVFVLVFLATLANIFNAQGPRLAEETAAGYDVLVDSNEANPATDAELSRQPGVASAATLTRALPKFYAPQVNPEADFWFMSGFDEGLLERGGPVLSSRLDRFHSDEAVWRAVLDEPGLAVVPDFFLQEGGPPEGQLRPGDEFTVINPVGDEETTLTVAAVVEGDWTFNGPMVSSDVIGDFSDRVVANRHYVAVEDGLDPDEVAEELNGAMIANGVDAESFRSIVDDGLAEQNGFFRLMEGFLALGLVIGIAGLGVVMVRAVRERRREIGMLRAMGIGAGVVRSAFLVEATFIALQGITLGVALGLITSWSVLSQSATFGDQPLPFSVPWAALVILPAAALAASLLAVYAPAAEASRTKPAVALRVTD